ncbi:restriction endonuclease subunit S [Sphaerotilus microaerophilus]|uniref:Type I restriction-modification enzyme, S subunit n=1 Tax=Sphaerotilus microaerophilus TaxID=2914710 RepID=A0ABM7YNU4_9BURK|nr:restriction endonuclease subunit S [Sphaerotilus sp. FB-5]BDI06170.1 type I restriction-modification enzyme, S subunit [Sphaerotilus sp. FB-5]
MSDLKHLDKGAIPDNWEVVALADITDPQRPISYGIVQTGPRVVNGVKCLRVVDIDGGQINKSDLITTSQEISESYRRTILRSGDLVMPLRGKVGDVGIVDDELEGANLTRGVALIAVKSGWSPEFIRQAISSRETRRQLENSMNGSALQEIPIATLRSFRILAPKGISEQRAIAAALSDIDALLSGLDRLIAKKRDLKQAAQQLLTGKTRLPGFEGEWEVRRLGDIAGIQRGASPRPIDSPVWFDDGSAIGWVRISDITGAGKFLLETSQRLSPLGVKHSRFVPAGSLIMSICATVGRPVITKIDVCIHDGFVVMDDLDAEQLFIYYVLKWVEPDWSRHGQTGSQMNLNTGLIKDLLLKLPSRGEQNAIANVLSDMDAELVALEARREKTRALKQGMMQELLTGRTRLV